MLRAVRKDGSPRQLGPGRGRQRGGWWAGVVGRWGSCSRGRGESLGAGQEALRGAPWASGRTEWILLSLQWVLGAENTALANTAGGRFRERGPTTAGQGSSVLAQQPSEVLVGAAPLLDLSRRQGPCHLCHAFHHVVARWLLFLRLLCKDHEEERCCNPVCCPQAMFLLCFLLTPSRLGSLPGWPASPPVPGVLAGTP